MVTVRDFFCKFKLCWSFLVGECLARQGYSNWPLFEIPKHEHNLTDFKITKLLISYFT